MPIQKPTFTYISNATAVLALQYLFATSNVYLPNLAKAIVIMQQRTHLIMLLQLFCIKTCSR